VTFKCGICGREYATVQERYMCEHECLEKQQAKTKATVESLNKAYQKYAEARTEFEVLFTKYLCEEMSNTTTVEIVTPKITAQEFHSLWDVTGML